MATELILQILLEHIKESDDSVDWYTEVVVNKIYKLYLFMLEQKFSKFVFQINILNFLFGLHLVLIFLNLKQANKLFFSDKLCEIECFNKLFDVV